VGPAVFGIAFFHPGNPVSANSKITEDRGQRSEVR
jgi:hypothetical protein